MRKVLLLLFLFCTPCFLLPVGAETDEYQEGFLTAYLNRGIEKTMSKIEEGEEKLTYGRNITRYVSAPKFGGYIIGSYSYSSKDNKGTNGFDGRMIRAYVSGTVLRDFRYRIQLELRGTPAMRDYTLEWVRFKEFQVKIGQFKRCFTYENPLNPWDVGFGGYAQIGRIMTALSSDDCSGEKAQNGRDQGLQLQGDLFPVGKDRRRLIRYQAAVFNGNGQNRKDNNSKKDWMGNIQVQPIQDLYVGLFGWTGTFTGDNGVSVKRNRWAIGANYEHSGWSARAEYAHHSGRNVDDFDPETQAWKGGAEEADGWYAQVGVPVNAWLKIYGRYDVYRKDATWNTTCSIYSFCPNFQLHRNLCFQLQYNYIHDRTAADRDIHEVWAQTYVRF